MATFEPLELTSSGKRETNAWANDQGRACLPGLMDQALQNCRLFGRGGHTVVEVGSWAGAHALRLAQAGWIVYCVDTWRGAATDCTRVIADTLTPRSVFTTFCRNMGTELFFRVFPCVGQSLTWASVWPHPAAVVFIDADHSEQSVWDDMNAWWPHVHPGGLFCGHDVNLFPGVRRAFERWKKLHPECEHGEDGEVWWTWKPMENSNDKA